MLDLAGSTRTVAGVTLGPDTDDPSHWYALPGRPRPAADADVQLLRFVRDGAVTGGYLHLAVDLGVDPAASAAAAAALTGAAGATPTTVTALPVLAAEADLVFYGRENAQPGTASPLVLTRYGTSVLQAQVPHRGVFAITLTAEGVAVVEAGLRSGALPVGITCRLTTEGLWPALRVTATVDWHSVYDHFCSDYKLGALLVSEDVSHLMQRLAQSGAVRVTVIDAPLPSADPGSGAAAIAAALGFVQSELLDRFCRPVLPLQTDPAQATPGSAGDLLDLGAAYEVIALTEIEDATGYYDFSQGTVARRVLTTQATLGDLLGGADPATVIADAGTDDPFFTRFHLDCRAARPLADSQLAEVVVDVGYGTSSGSIRLTPDTSTGGFDSFADASADGSWTVTPRTTFAVDSPVDPGVVVTLPPLCGTTRDLTIDLDAALGLARLDLEGATDPRIVATALTVTETSAGTPRAVRSVSLTPAAPRASAWFRDHRDGDCLTVSGVHLLADGRQVTLGATLADTTLFRVPNPYAGTFTVQIVTDPAWTDLTQVVVAVQKDEAGPTRTFAFTQPGAAAVALDQPDPLDRTYRYKVSRTVAGVTTDDPWSVSDRPLLAVGRTAAGDLIVDVEPVGAEPTSVGLRLVQVDLLYVDVAHQLRAEHTHVIAAKSDSYRWQVHLADPTLRGYRYRITKQLLRGDTVNGAWVDSADPILPVPITAS